MTFLAPAALFGILLLALPIVVHLFKPRKMRPTPFSSLRWLKQTHQRLSRRIQWHQWLLFLMRAGCILLLVLALAKPLMGLWGQRTSVDRFILVDVSRDMGYESPGQPTPLERAQELALRLVEQSKPGDRIALVLVGTRPHLAAPLSSDSTAAVAALRTVQVEAGEGALAQCLPLVRSLAAASGERDRELVLFTTNLQQAWQQSAIHELMARAVNPAELPRIQVVDVGPGASASNGWISGVRVIPSEDQDRLVRVEIGCVGEAQRQRSVRLTGIAGLSDEVQPVSLTPGQLTRVDFTIPQGANLKGQVAEVRLEPADSLPGDDRYFLNLDVAWSLRTLIVQPEAPREEAVGPGLFILEGLRSLADKKNRALEVDVRAAKAVAASDLQSADIIVLAGAPFLQDAALEALEQRVRAGAGLIVFLGNTLNVSFYNDKLFKAVQPGEGLLPMPLPGGADKIKRGGPATLGQVLWSHPLLAGLNDPNVGDLARSRFHSYWNLTLPGKDDAVLARFDDAVPALIERPFGAGRVLIWNTTADDDWSDLPRSRAFVPLLDRAVGYLTGGGVRRQVVVGDSLSLPLPGWQSGETIKLMDPSGSVVQHRLQGRGAQTFLQVDDLTRPGVYRVERPDQADKSFPLAVNVPRGRSALQVMDGKTLEEWWMPAACEVIGGEAFAQRLDSQGSGWPLWPTLMLLAGLLLLAETVYVHRLCPRRNPDVVESVVPQRGMLKPMSPTT